MNLIASSPLWICATSGEEDEEDEEEDSLDVEHPAMDPPSDESDSGQPEDAPSRSRSPEPSWIPCSGEGTRPQPQCPGVEVINLEIRALRQTLLERDEEIERLKEELNAVTFDPNAPAF